MIAPFYMQKEKSVMRAYVKGLTQLLSTLLKIDGLYKWPLHGSKQYPKPDTLSRQCYQRDGT